MVAPSSDGSAIPRDSFVYDGSAIERRVRYSRRFVFYRNYTSQTFLSAYYIFPICTYNSNSFKNIGFGVQEKKVKQCSEFYRVVKSLKLETYFFNFSDEPSNQRRRKTRSHVQKFLLHRCANPDIITSALHDVKEC